MKLGKHTGKITGQAVLSATVVFLAITNILFLSLFLREHSKVTKLQLPVSGTTVAGRTAIEPHPEPPVGTVTSQAKTPSPVEAGNRAPEAQPVPPPPPPYPSALISAQTGEYAFVCEKKTKLLHLFRVTDGGKFDPVKSYPCIIGANNGDKQKEGDFATPEGIYFFLRFVPGDSLPKQYGFGAFVLNYPNYLGRKQGRNGNGIWLHGHDPDKVIGKDVPSTKGCIAVDNGALEEIASLVNANGTPIVITNQIEPVQKDKREGLAKNLVQFLESWRSSWESKNTRKYLGFYAPDFVNGQGMGYGAFKDHKEKVNRNKKYIKVAVEKPFVLMSPEYGPDMAVIRFTQKYVSDNFKSEGGKIFYVKRTGPEWQIFGESMF